MANNELIALRHWLHAHPDLSRREEQTAGHLRRFLAEHAPPDEIVALHGAGFAAVYNGRAAGPSVMIRAELDALPIPDVNDLSYRSVVAGVGHKCGHDGHMTILAGLAQTLARRPGRGRVILLFQPDEETGTGARGCVTHPDFARIAPDLVLALHNLPGFPVGQVVCKPGPFASAVKYVAMRLEGKEAHSAQPETGTSPALALAELTLAARQVQARFDTAEDYALIVPIFARMGVQSSGVSPAAGEAHFTLRTARGDMLGQMWLDLEQQARDIAARHGLQITFETLEEFAATSNSPAGFDLIRSAAAKAGFSFAQIEHPFRWGEDFGELTARHPGAMFGLGAGMDQPALHNPDYDFPDTLLDIGIAMFATLIDETLNCSRRGNTHPLVAH